MEFSRLEEQMLRSIYSPELCNALLLGHFEPTALPTDENEPGIVPDLEAGDLLAPPGPNPVELAALLMLAQAVETEEAFKQLRQFGVFTVMNCDRVDWIGPLINVLERALKPYGRAITNPSTDYLSSYSASHAYHVILSPESGDGYFNSGSKKKKPSRIGDSNVLECLAARRPTIAIVPRGNGALSDWARSLAYRTLQVPDLSNGILSKLLHILCPTSHDEVVPLVPGLSPSAIAVALASTVDRAAVIARLIHLPPADQQDKKAVGGATLEDLVGLNALKQWGISLKKDVDAIKAGNLELSQLPRGLLLSGPPGTGKSKGVKIVADYAGVPTIFASVGRWISVGDGHLGTFVRAMLDDFGKAAAAAPAMLILDEIDAFPSRGRDNSHWFDAAQSALLEALDGLDSAAGVVTVGICNQPERLDHALRRAGRFDHSIAVKNPDIYELAAMYRLCLRPDLQDADFRPLATMTIGGTIADVDRICKDAQRRARSDGRGIVLDDLVSVVLADRIIESPLDRERTALHEAAHALVAHIEGITIHWVSISTTGLDGTRGSVATDLSPESWALDRIRSVVRHLLAGHAAENHFLGGATFGAASDLQMATRLLTRAGGTEGMLGALLWHRPDWLADIARTPSLAGIIETTLAELYKQVTQQLADHEAALFRLRDALVKDIFLDRKAVADLLHDVAVAPGMATDREEGRC